jgi:hypothetical protein
MNPANIIAALTLLETLFQQVAGVVSDIKAAQAAGTDLTAAQVEGYRDAANAAIAQLEADIQAANKPPAS